MKENPIKEWIARVAEECGSPVAMLMWAGHVGNANTRKLIIDYATLWQGKLGLKKSKSSST